MCNWLISKTLPPLSLFPLLHRQSATRIICNGCIIYVWACQVRDGSCQSTTLTCLRERGASGGARGRESEGKLAGGILISV